jgi:dienelactone hydrolase
MSNTTEELPPHLRPFVLPHESLEPTRMGTLDLYLPAAAPAPAVLMVHGGPVPLDRAVRPPDWPSFRGYGALLAQAGIVGAMFEHGFVDEQTFAPAQQNIRAAAGAVRANPAVDPDRLGLWFFSAGGLFMGSVLADPSAWGVSAVAGTYAAVAHPAITHPAFPTATKTAELSTIPLLLVRPERDFDWIATATTELLDRSDAAHRPVDVIEVPGAQHGFETVDNTDDARDAIQRSIAWWTRTLSASPA